MLEFPLAAPSANPFGYISPTNPKHVDMQLGSCVDYILDGGSSKVGIESTIIGFDNNEVVIYRYGGISVEKIKEVTKKIKININETTPQAPGMIDVHYSPHKPLLIGEIPDLLNKYPLKKIAVISFCKNYSNKNIHLCEVLSESKDLEEAARNLFAALRQADTSDAEFIVTEKFPNTNLGKAINDRLDRASIKFVS